MSKTLIPYVIWSMIGMFFQFYYLKSIQSINLMFIIDCLLTGRAMDAYWFFIPLFELYFLFPLFVYFVDNKKYCLFFMGLLLVVNSILNFFNLHMIGYAFFAVFGFYMHKYGVSNKMRYLFYSLAIFGFLTNTFCSYYISTVTGQLFSSYIHYTFIPAMFYPLGLFVFMKYDLVKMMKHEYMIKMVSFLEFYTFGIYLIHWYILKMLIKLFNININSMVYRLGSPFVVMMMCIIIIKFLRKIPLMKKMVP